jgi:rhodanese-related sulfurtransferase
VPPVSASPDELRSAVNDIARRWPYIDHIAPAQLEPVMAAGEAALFDVRTSAEYQVSHLPGAVRIEPGMRAQAFLDQYGDAVKGKTVVFYCSVGVRSSKLAERVAHALKARGATGVHDLAGGIFAWHGEARPLVDAAGATDFVHPYDATWGRLLARPGLARTVPRG